MVTFDDGHTVWVKDPPDGHLCLVATRRVLDVNGHCCDYLRCPSLHPTVRGLDRCLRNPNHAGDHHGVRCLRW
jgi:hypothetical protein